VQGLDVFARDFLFVPIHDHLHWSLLVICHPGADASAGGALPCFLHLDSMSSAPLPLPPYSLLPVLLPP
jgi:Ulp1 family protease